MKDTISQKQPREFGLLIGWDPNLIGWLLPSIAGHGPSVDSMGRGTRVNSRTDGTPLLHYPYKGWMALGQALGWVNSHIILGLVFIVVLQPIAFFMRFTGYDPLRRRRKGEITYRENRQDHRTDLTRIF